ncbi:MAG: ZIP family metal transporter [Candidatus Aenigmarchaeota archaeon]|nr:ZIP family metal transporter [Candidatus Aenigmarchaeota archaeon]
MELIFIIISTFIISLISFVGMFCLLLKEKTLNKILLFFISFSAGALLSGAFFHLLSEAINEKSSNLIKIFLYFIFGYISFLFLEKIIKWRHCHDYKCKIHSFGYMNLVGDLLHNFIDGIVIASSFLVNLNFGFVTTFLIALHEIPQELGDFGVLIYSGFKVKRAIFLNFITALSCVLGGIVGYYFLGNILSMIPILLSFAGGGFLYISSSDLIPILREKTKIKEFIKNFLVFLLGIILIYLITILE